MKLKKILALIFGALLIPSILTLSGCGCNDNNYDDTTNYVAMDPLTNYFDPTLAAGTIEFTHLFLDSTSFNRIIPLGQIYPRGHTFPTDHIYFVLAGTDHPVYAPASGKVLYIDEPSTYGDRAIRIGVTSTMAYYLGHIHISDGIEVGDTVVAGEQIGISGDTQCVDFGVVNQNIGNQFLNTNYPKTTLYGDKPLQYYLEPLKTQLYSLIFPPELINDKESYDGGTTDGGFAYDVLGTLSGNWLREGCFDDQGWYEWEDELSFGYDTYYSNQIRIGLGTYDNAFALDNTENPINPVDVTTATGIVTYNLYNANNTFYGLPTDETPMAIMLVQMISDTRIKLEIFQANSASDTFTSAATYYVR